MWGLRGLWVSGFRVEGLRGQGGGVEGFRASGFGLGVQDVGVEKFRGFRS